MSHSSSPSATNPGARNESGDVPTGRLFARHALTPSGWLDNALIEVDDRGVIRDVSQAIRGTRADHEADILLPAGVNVHSHAFQRLMVGRTEQFSRAEDDFWSWRTQMYQFVRELTPERLYDVARRLYSDMLQAGTTTVCEFHYVHHLYRGSAHDSARAIGRAARDAGIRLCLLPVLYRFGGFGGRDPSEQQRAFVFDTDAYLRLVQDLRDELSSPGQVTVGYAPHSLRAVGYDDLKQVLDHRRATSPEAPFHMHVAEQVREINEAALALGSRPVQWLFDRFDPDEGWCLIHATHLDDKERTALSKSAATVGLCPTTEANLGDGVFPLPEFAAAGGRFTIGSDSNLTVSTAEEIRLLDYTHRLRTRRRNALGRREQPAFHPATWLYAQAASNGARVSGLPVGRVEAGCAADFVSLTTSHPLTDGARPDEVVAAWVYAAGSELIDTVFVGGRPSGRA